MIMPARSKSQQRLFGMVHAYQKGELKNVSKNIEDIAKHISEEDAEHFAKTKHKNLPEKKAAYLLGFMDKLAEYGITKEAKSLTRLLARVGPDLAGATERDLKVLARRGLKGFAPQQVQALRAKGLLPSIEQELSGFNKGTENMLHGAKIRYTDYPRGPGYRVHLVKGKPVATIPGAKPSASLKEQEARAATARHEAREFVRNNAWNKKTPDRHWYVPQYGAKHMPGVLHDERLFRSQLSNRLGMDTSWSDLPIFYGKNGYIANPIMRAPREVYIGNQPLSYDSNMRRRWIRLWESEHDRLLSHIRPRVKALGPDLDAAIKGVDERLLDKGYISRLSPKTVRRYFTGHVLGDDISGVEQRLSRTLPSDKMSRLASARESYRDALYSPIGYSKDFPNYDYGDIIDIVDNRRLPDSALRGELGKLLSISKRPRENLMGAAQFF